MTTTAELWVMSPERDIETPAGKFRLAVHDKNRAGARSEPFEINHRDAPAGDIRLAHGIFRAIRIELQLVEGIWAVGEITGARMDNRDYFGSPVTPLFRKAAEKLIVPALIEYLDGNPLFIEEGGRAARSRDRASLQGQIERKTEQRNELDREIGQLALDLRTLT